MDPQMAGALLDLGYLQAPRVQIGLPSPCGRRGADVTDLARRGGWPHPGRSSARRGERPSRLRVHNLTPAELLAPRADVWRKQADRCGGRGAKRDSVDECEECLGFEGGPRRP